MLVVQINTHTLGFELFKLVIFIKCTQRWNHVLVLRLFFFFHRSLRGLFCVFGYSHLARLVKTVVRVVRNGGVQWSITATWLKFTNALPWARTEVDIIVDLRRTDAAMHAVSSMLAVLRAYVFLFCAVVASSAYATNWKNALFQKTLDLGGSLAYFQYAISAELLDTQGDDTWTYQIYLSKKEADKLAFISATSTNDDNQEVQHLEVIPHGVLDGDNETYKYLVVLPKDVVLTDNLVHMRVLGSYLYPSVPRPAEAPQGSPQLLAWQGDVGLRTPYETIQGSFMVRIPDQILSYSPKALAERKGKNIFFGPYQNLPPFTPGMALEQGSVHYQYPKAVATFVEFKRHVEVSHWGDNLAMEDNIWLRNDGPLLKGHFSRFEHMKSLVMDPKFEVASQIHQLPIMLPPGAKDVYYVDAVGNVTTSNLGPAVPGMHRRLDVKPRYPILGGWNYTFTVGWNQGMSTNGVARKLPGNPWRTQVAIPFLVAPKSVAVVSAQLRIVLPEGASDIRVSVPFSMEEIRTDIYPTYLDTTGRPSVLLTRKYCTAKQNELVFIEYTLTPLALLRKPLAVAVAVLVIFFASAVMRRQFSSA